MCGPKRDKIDGVPRYDSGEALGARFVWQEGQEFDTRGGGAIRSLAEIALKLNSLINAFFYSNTDVFSLFSKAKLNFLVWDLPP